MGMNDGSRWFNAPTYTDLEWTTRNPLLQAGEVGWELHPITNNPWRSKIGPGYWNDLGYQLDIYPYNDIVTNEIGDAKGNLQYLSNIEILHKMLNPFQVPVLSAPLMTIDGMPFDNPLLLEIGQALVSPAQIKCTVSPVINLALTPFIINSSGFFNNDGAFATLPASLTISGGSITPSAVTEVFVQLKALLTNGAFTNQVTGRINVYPKMIWGCSNALSLAPGDWASITARQTLISKSYENDYQLGTAGYGYLAIPSMLSPGLPIFTDVTNPDYPGPYDWDYVGAQTINNGVGTYSYQVYRTTYMMDSDSVVRVKQS